MLYSRISPRTYQDIVLPLRRIRAVRFNEYHPRVEMGFSAGGVKMCVPPDTGITGGGKRPICIHETIQDCRRNKYWTSDF